MNIKQWEEVPLSSASRKECLKVRKVIHEDHYYVNVEDLNRLNDKAVELAKGVN